MGKENFVVLPEFILKPADIFQSAETDGLNDYGMACQAIIVRQVAIKEAETERWSPHVVGSLRDEITSLRKEHNIPEEALPILKEQFYKAAKEQYQATVQAATPRAGWPDIKHPALQPVLVSRR